MSEFDNKIISIFSKYDNFILVIKYIEKYLKNKDLWEKAFIDFYNRLKIKLRNNEIDEFKEKLLLALKKLKLDCKKRNLLLNELEQVNNEVVLKSYPRILEIGLTGGCNLRCKMCYLSYLDDYRSKQLTQDQVSQIIGLFKYAEYVMWIGGEPLIYKNFEELVDIANKFDIKQEIFTNGLLLNEDFIKKIVDYNIKLYISIDSVNKEVYEQIRVGAKFDNLLEKISFLYKYRMSKEIKNENILLVVLSKWNYEIENNFEEIIEFANKYKFTGVNINVDNREEDLLLKNKYIQAFNLHRKRLVDLASKYSIELQIFVPELKQNISCDVNKNIDSNNKRDVILNDSKYPKYQKINSFAEKFCVVPWKKLYINFDGNIRINCDCPNVGNFSGKELTKNFLFNDVWNGKEMIKYRKKIIDNDLKYISKICFHMSKEEQHLRK